MIVGELRHKITIQDKGRTADGMGGFTESWYKFATCYAAIWPISANERMRNAELSGEITHRIKIRYRSGVTRSQRIKFVKNGATRYFAIIAPPINTEERNQWIELLCKESA